jgi:predicted metal-dependent peptidase
MSMVRCVKLTPKQEKQWSDSRVALMWHCPAFTHILYEMLNRGGDIALFTDDESICPIAATDGNSLILNPNTFFTFNLSERVFIMAHEILHCIMNHCGLMHQLASRGKVSYPDGKVLDYAHEPMNMAADYVINDCLIESKIGAMPHKDGKQVGLWDKNTATGKDSVLDAYRKIYKKPPAGQPGGGQGNGQGQGQSMGGGGFDKHLKPGTSQGKDATQAVKDRNEAEWQTQIQAGLNSAKAQGKLPAGLERMFKEMLEPQVDWTEKIQALFARKVGSGSWDFRRPDRRLITRDIFVPSRSGFGAGCVVVGVDTSGSIGMKELDMFFAEMAGILEEVKPQRLLVMWCDADVHRVDECEEVSDLLVLRSKKVPGGGGTDFRPVFKEITDRDLSPDALVYLTDGMGSFPGVAPNYPVIWGNIYTGSKYPFGDVVDIPKQVKD